MCCNLHMVRAVALQLAHVESSLVVGILHMVRMIALQLAHGESGCFTTCYG